MAPWNEIIIIHLWLCFCFCLCMLYFMFFLCYNIWEKYVIFFCTLIFLLLLLLLVCFLLFYPTSPQRFLFVLSFFFVFLFLYNRHHFNDKENLYRISAFISKQFCSFWSKNHNVYLCKFHHVHTIYDGTHSLLLVSWHSLKFCLSRVP